MSFNKMDHLIMIPLESLDYIVDSSSIIPILMQTDFADSANQELLFNPLALS